MNIISFLKRVNVEAFALEITRICGLTEEQSRELLLNLNLNMDQFKSLSPQQEVNAIRQSIHQSTHRRRNNNIANVVGNVVISSATTGVNPMDVVHFIGVVISIPFRIIFFFMQLAG
jgi:hypothetical protein